MSGPEVVEPKVEELWKRARLMSGFGDERIRCLEDIVDMSPKHARAKALLGILLANRGGEENKRRALSLCRAAVDLKPEDLPLRIALGRLADGEEKRGALHTALQFDPDNLEAMVLLITASQSFGTQEEDIYMRIKQQIEDSDVDYHYALGAYFRRKDVTKCRHHYERVVLKMERAESDPKGLCDKARFWLCTLGGEGGENNTDFGAGVVKRCPREYITSLYKSFAPKFDELLVDKLQYRTPALLRESVNSFFADSSSCANFLDLGCGTGLSGLSFRSLVSDGAFVGVDLSPDMLEKAKERDCCYTELLCSDVETFVNEKAILKAAPFSLIVSCDVFVYLGSLDVVFENVKSVKSADGIFAFSVELLDEGRPMDYLCMNVARFAHKKSYIENLANAVGFEVLAMRESVLRKNAGDDVAGLLVVLK
ncbi:hypothetical protein TrCOL_g1206 [Triparma columacea]|uniref:Methyltransferase type 12 domain-containing protein n=1 Tax=Triparma columacea TaxID=722753 RepID=A0A9W7LFJ4_9STRA|nr:hypothetical protein TrCOL_g1206 [Triparma columacea]